MRTDFFEIRDSRLVIQEVLFVAIRLCLLLSICAVTTGFHVLIAAPPGNANSSESQLDSDDKRQTSDKKERNQAKDDEGKASAGTDRQKAGETKIGETADPAEVAKERKAREAAKKRGEITFDDLKFAIEKGEAFKPEMLSDDNKDLHKKTWKIRGFILPTTLFSKSNIREFVLVRDNQECCFGPGAALYDCIMVTMAPGKSINFSTRVVAVKGVLEIDTESFLYPDSEEHYAIYKMTAEEVK